MVIEIMSKLIKQRKESIKSYIEGNSTPADADTYRQVCLVDILSHHPTFTSLSILIAQSTTLSNNSHLYMIFLYYIN